MDDIKISSNRSFGIVFFVVFLLIALYPLTYGGETRLWSLIISIILLALVIIGAVLKDLSNVGLYFKQSGLITLILNLSMMIIAFYIGKFFVSSFKQTKTFIYELGLQNGTIAIFVAQNIFGDQIFAIPAITYSLIMFFTSIVSLYFIKNKES